jgi:hypothetical protein
VRIIGTQGRLTSGLAPAARSKLTFATPWMSRARNLSSESFASTRQRIWVAEDSNRQGCVLKYRASRRFRSSENWPSRHLGE